MDHYITPNGSLEACSTNSNYIICGFILNIRKENSTGLIYLFKNRTFKYSYWIKILHHSKTDSREGCIGTIMSRTVVMTVYCMLLFRRGRPGSDNDRGIA
jgi:hypothetical protein